MPVSWAIATSVVSELPVRSSSNTGTLDSAPPSTSEDVQEMLEPMSELFDKSEAVVASRPPRRPPELEAASDQNCVREPLSKQWLSLACDIGPVQREPCSPFEDRPPVSIWLMLNGNRSTSCGYIIGNVRCSPCERWCWEILFLWFQSCLSVIHCVQQANENFEPCSYDQFSSALLDTSIGSGSCVTGTFIQDSETCSVLSWWSSCYAPVLIENFLEDGNILKCKERVQCLFGEILVETAVWLNDRVGCSMRVLNQLSWCALNPWSPLLLMIYTYWLLLEHVSVGVDVLDVRFLMWINIVIFSGCNTPLPESVNTGLKQRALDGIIIFLQDGHVDITKGNNRTCFSYRILVRLAVANHLAVYSNGPAFLQLDLGTNTKEYSDCKDSMMVVNNSAISIHVKELQGVYVSAHLQWGNIVSVLTCGLIHLGKFCPNWKFAHSAIGRPAWPVPIQSVALKNMELWCFTTAVWTEIFSVWFPLQMSVTCSAQPKLLLTHVYQLTCDPSEGSRCYVLIGLNLHRTISFADSGSLVWDAQEAVFGEIGSQLSLHLVCPCSLVFNAIKGLQDSWKPGMSHRYYLTAFADKMRIDHVDNQGQVCPDHDYQLAFFQAQPNHGYFSGFRCDPGTKKHSLSGNPGGRHMTTLAQHMVLRLPWDPGGEVAA